MASNERIKKYLEAGTVLGQVTRARAEEIVRELVSAGDVQREQAQEWVDNLVDRSRKTSEQMLELVRHEVSSQLSKIDTASLESIAGQVADILKRSASAGRAATAEATAQATKTAKAARDAAQSVTPGSRKKKKPEKKTAAKKAPEEGTGQEGHRQEGGCRQEARPRRPARVGQATEPRRLDVGSTLNLFGGASSQIDKRHRRSSPPAWLSSAGLPADKAGSIGRIRASRSGCWDPLHRL